MTGKFGFQDGLKFSKVKKCKCGNYYNGPADMCDECFFKNNYIKMNNCVLENAQGRCEEGDKCPFYNKCLNATAARGWNGWRKING
jgi:hypothetical protein